MGGLETPVGIHAVERADRGGQVAVGTAIAESVPVKDVRVCGGDIVISGAVIVALRYGESAGLVVNAHTLGTFALVLMQ